MTEEEKNVYKCLFEYPTKKIASLEIENLTLEKELEKHKNNWEELKRWLEQEYLEWKDCEDVMTKNFATEDKNILNKMKELEEKNEKN